MIYLKKIKLVLSGSGTKFPVFAGALKRLEEEGYVITDVIGTSGGSIVAAAIASGYDSARLIKLCKEIMPRLSKMVDYSLLNFVTNLGFIKDKPIHEELEKHFVEKFKDAKIPLSVVTVNFDLEKEEIFTSKGNPEVHVWRAVAASMAIPAVFPPVAVNGDWHIDGGVMKNFAIDFFKDADDVVGLYFQDKGGVRKPRPKGWKKVAMFLGRVINLLINAKTNDDIEDAPHAMAIPLVSKVDGLDFSFAPEEVEQMIQEGYKQVDAYLKTRGI